MHDFYKDRQVSTLQERLFLHDYFPEYVLNPQDANFEFQRGKGELVPLDEAEAALLLKALFLILLEYCVYNLVNVGPRLLVITS